MYSGERIRGFPAVVTTGAVNLVYRELGVIYSIDPGFLLNDHA